MYVNNLLSKRGLKFYKKIFWIFVDSKFFIVRVFIDMQVEREQMASFSPDTWQLQISCQQSIKNFLNMIIYTDRFSRVILKSNAWQSN